MREWAGTVPGTRLMSGRGTNGCLSKVEVEAEGGYLPQSKKVKEDKHAELSVSFMRRL